MNKFRPCFVFGLWLLQDMSRNVQLQQFCCHHRALHLHLQLQLQLHLHLGLWHALSLLHRIGSPTTKWLPHCTNLFIKFTLNFHVAHEHERKCSTLLFIQSFAENFQSSTKQYGSPAPAAVVIKSSPWLAEESNMRVNTCIMCMCMCVVPSVLRLVCLSVCPSACPPAINCM